MLRVLPRFSVDIKLPCKMELAILRTLCYHDLFDYPLTLEETHRFLIGKKKGEIKNLIKEGKVEEKDGFYFLKGKRETVSLRKKREKISRKKLVLAQRMADWFRLIPTIKMIAVTGALAINNSQKDDDIDFLIVTSKNGLWLTRIPAVLLIELLASRPQLDKGRLKDTICLNIFLDENHLQMPKEKQNLFVAHEIVQMKPLWQKDEVYQKFLKKNQWVAKYLPNWKR